MITSMTVCAETYHLEWSKLEDSNISFEGAAHSSIDLYLPVFNMRRVGQVGVEQSLRNVQTKKISSSIFHRDVLSNIGEDWKVRVQYGKINGVEYTTVEVLPFRKSGDHELEILESFDLDFKSNSFRRENNLPVLSHKNNSVLASGEWYKIGVRQNGVYKIDRDFLEQIGVGAESITQVKVYGHRGGMLDELAGGERTDDLEEIPTKIVGQGNSAVVYIYLEGPEKWLYDSAINNYQYIKNLYTDTKNYFITINSASGRKVISANPVSNAANQEINGYDNYLHIEEDLVNLLSSGRLWLGQEFGGSNQLDFNFDFDKINSAVPIKVTLGLAAKSPLNSNPFQIFLMEMF